LSAPCGFECVEGYYKFKNPFVLGSSFNLNLNVIEGLMSVLESKTLQDIYRHLAI
jgi:hypothetical protein